MSLTTGFYHQPNLVCADEAEYEDLVYLDFHHARGDHARRDDLAMDLNYLDDDKNINYKSIHTSRCKTPLDTARKTSGLRMALGPKSGIDLNFELSLRNNLNSCSAGEDFPGEHEIHQSGSLGPDSWVYSHH